MYTIILSRQTEQTALIENLLSKENCSSKTLSALSTLEREIRMGFPDFLLIDPKYFTNEQTTAKKLSQSNHLSCFSDIIFPIDICFPIFIFDCNQIEFTQYYISEYQKSISIPTNDIILLLTQIKNNINIFIQTSQTQFRPAEKKLYLLLKDKNNEAISLEQMAESLWGCSTSANKKTLYSHIHRIKHVLKKNEYSPEWLIKEKKGFYKLAIRKP